MTFAAEQVTIEGASSSYMRGPDDGFWGRHHFCPTCGVSVWYEIERRPGMISIPAGTFADPAFAWPTIAVYGERRCPWLPDLGCPEDC